MAINWEIEEEEEGVGKVAETDETFLPESEPFPSSSSSILPPPSPPDKTNFGKFRPPPPDWSLSGKKEKLAIRTSSRAAFYVWQVWSYDIRSVWRPASITYIRQIRVEN